MNISDWIAFGALAVAAVAPIAGTLRAGGRRDGKLDAVLERVVEIQGDHETRIRVLEHDKS